jgi:hypothetical protein
MLQEDRFIVGSSPSKILKLFALSVLFVLLGFAFVTNPDAFDLAAPGIVKVVGWASIAFFGLAIPIFLVQLFQRKPEFIIDRTGITYPKWSEHVIKWTSITNIGTTDVANTKFMTVQLAQEAPERATGPKGAMTRLNRSMTGGELSIPLASANKSLSEVMAAVERFRAAP